MNPLKYSPVFCLQDSPPIHTVPQDLWIYSVFWMDPLGSRSSSHTQTDTSCTNTSGPSHALPAPPPREVPLKVSHPVGIAQEHDREAPYGHPLDQSGPGVLLVARLHIGPALAELGVQKFFHSHCVGGPPEEDAFGGGKNNNKRCDDCECDWPRFH